jgi:hypothetical protein
VVGVGVDVVGVGVDVVGVGVDVVGVGVGGNKVVEGVGVVPERI